MIPIKFIHTLTDEALNSLIKKYSKRANSRIDRLLKSGYWSKSPYIQRKWHPVTHTEPIGTPSGRFSRSIKGTRGVREEQLKQIINFLNAKTTLKEVKVEINKFYKKLGYDTTTEEGLDKADLIMRMFDRYYLVFKSQDIDSDTAQRIITEMVEGGLNESQITNLIDNAIATAIDKDEFLQMATDDYKYFQF